MKGAIAQCLGDLVINKFGREKWEEALEKAGLSRKSIFTPVQDVDDAAVMKVVEAVCQVLNISVQQAADAFGDYWVNVYAQKVYSSFFRGINSAKDFLLKMDRVHEITTKNVPNARPPRFEYDWKDDKTLVMTYKSQRRLIDFMLGLIKGVGKHYKEELKVTKLGSDKVQIVFP